MLQVLKLYEPAVAVRRWLDNRDPKYVEFYGQFVKRGDLCFDVGAHTGMRTKTFLKLGASVVAVEPQEACLGKLRKKFGGNDKVVLVEKALGKEEGEVEMMISNVNVLSSLSKQWVDSVRKSGRYAEMAWDRKVMVPVTTLDGLIAEHGKPVFIKIDVEGYEYEVLQGLTEAVKAVSFEFTPEFMGGALGCIRHFSGIGEYRFNYSTGETMSLCVEEWVKAEEMCDILEGLPDKKVAGDVYARLID